MKEKEFIRYRRGIGCRRVLLEGTHVVAPQKEFWIEDILQQAACRAGSHLLLATRSREVADLDRAAGYRGDTIISNLQEQAVEEYRATIANLIGSADLVTEEGRLQAPFLHVSVHGMKSQRDEDLELGTREGASCSSEIEHWMVDLLRSWSSEQLEEDLTLAVNQRDSSASSLALLRQGSENGHDGFGTDFHSVRLEFAHWLRSDPDLREKLTFFLARIARAFHKRYPGADAS